jgi:hypothetical protein
MKRLKSRAVREGSADRGRPLGAADLWQQTVGRGAGGRSPRVKALGALRKGVEECNLAPHIGIAIGRGLKLFTDYLPRHLPEFGDQFRAATGLSVDQYMSCATALNIYIQQWTKDGPLFITHTVAAATTYKEIYPTFFTLESQTPDELAVSFWREFDKLG